MSQVYSFAIFVTTLYVAQGQECGLEFSQLQECIMTNSPTPPSAPDVNPQQIQSQATQCLLRAGCQNPFTNVKDAILERKKRQAPGNGQPQWPNRKGGPQRRRRFPPITPPPDLQPEQRGAWEEWAKKERMRRQQYFANQRKQAQAARRRAEAQARQSSSSTTEEGTKNEASFPRVQFSSYMQRAMKICKDRVVDSDIKPELVKCLRGSNKLSGFQFPSSSGSLGSGGNPMDKHVNAKIQLNLLIQLAGRVIEPGFCPDEASRRTAEACLSNLGELLSPKTGCKNPVESAFERLKLHQQTCNVFTQCKRQKISAGCEESFDTAYEAICECGTKLTSDFLRSAAEKMNACLAEEEQNVPERVTLDMRKAALQTMIAASQKDFTVQFCVVKTIPDPCRRMHG